MVKWFAAVNSSELVECLQKFDVNMIYLRNSGNKQKNDPLVSTETLRHSSTYIILYICIPGL